MKICQCPRDYNQRQNEPHFNTYYQPVGKPLKRKSKRLFTIVYLLNHHHYFIFRTNVFLSSRANVDDLQSIEKKSNFVSAQHMPEYVRGAFISMEDERFYKHHGFDIKGTVRALFSTIGERDVQGGSTITQQTVKTIITIMNARLRKIKELFVAHKVEKQYSKNQILSFI